MKVVRIKLKDKVYEALVEIKPAELTVEEFLQQLIQSFTIQRVIRRAMEKARREILKEIATW